MSDIGVELRSAVVTLDRTVVTQLSTTLVAIGAAEMVLHVALRTPVGEFPRWHRHEGTLGPLDDLQVPDDKTLIERDRTERQ